MADDVKKLRCKLPGCKSKDLNVAIYSNDSGTIRFNLCENCRKTSFGAKLIPYVESSRSIKAASGERNVEAKKRIDGAVETAADRIGLCQYPGCKIEDCKLWLTKSPHPFTGQHKGRYCVPHKDILNSDNRVMPYRFGRVVEALTASVMTMKEVDLQKIALDYGLQLSQVTTLYWACVGATGNNPGDVQYNGTMFRLTKTIESGVKNTSYDGVTSIDYATSSSDDIRIQIRRRELIATFDTGSITREQLDEGLAQLEPPPAPPTQETTPEAVGEVI